jgi:hypothetical protein
MEPLRPNDRRAKNAISMVWAVLILNIITAIFSVFGDIVFDESDFSGNGMIGIIALVMEVAIILYLIATIASVVTFIMWFRRAYFNLHQFRGDLLYGEGWAVGCWFIPVLNLYMPYQIMKDLYTKTNTILSQNLITCNKRLPIKYVNWWWILWLILSFLGYLSFIMTMLDSFYGSETTLDLITSALMIPLSFVTVMLIKDYSKIEEALTDIAVSDTYNISEESEPMPEVQNL